MHTELLVCELVVWGALAICMNVIHSVYVWHGRVGAGRVGGACKCCPGVSICIRIAWG